MNELLALADRVEREPVSRELWREAFDAAGGEAYYSLYSFDKFMDVGAHLDAADMLRPQEWFCDVDSQGNGEIVARMWCFDSDVEHIGAASGPDAEARARFAVALRARAAAGGGR